MIKRCIWLLIALSLLLSVVGCAPITELTEKPGIGDVLGALEKLEPPADGNPNDVTCKGTYTGQPETEMTVAQVGNVNLSNSQLQVWYWSAVASYQQSGAEEQPDYTQRLDVQPCTIDSTVNSWQQYFLKQALHSWHTAQALVIQGNEAGLPIEEDFSPNWEERAEYVPEDAVGLKYLYREQEGYQPNTMHQAYLDEIPALLDEIAIANAYTGGADLAAGAFGISEDELSSAVDTYNRGYMYYTNIGYYIEVTDEDIDAWFTEHEAEYAAKGITRDGGRFVTIRHALIQPEPYKYKPKLLVEISEDGIVTCDDLLWSYCKNKANTLISKCKTSRPYTMDAAVAEMANEHSKDPATSRDGGEYRLLTQGQLMPVLDEWVFDEKRKENDITAIRTEYGYHILYIKEYTDIWYYNAKQDLIAERQSELMEIAREAYPITVEYRNITLMNGSGTVSLEQALYPDVAHERFPEVPLYFQRDYPTTMYGRYPLRTHGCGISAFAMLASYLLDDELTPPEMCALHGRYCTKNGSDVTLFIYEPSNMGMYLREVTYNADDVKQALKDGYIVVSLQQPGYWTKVGHYMVLEKIYDDDTVLVRDSNLLNYTRIEGHLIDRHAWETIPPNDSTYWIFEKKIVDNDRCYRCGTNPDSEENTRFMQGEYLCEKCESALLRRGTYLAGT